MTANWRFVVLMVFVTGLLATGLLGTSTAMTFIWPGYLLIGLAGVLSIGTLFHRVSFAAPRWGLVLVFALAGYLLFRASDSPVAYFARGDAALLVVCLSCYLGVLSFCSDPADVGRRVVVAALGGLVAANLFFAVAQALGDPSLWLIPGYERTFTDRVGGLFNHPDHFAGFLAATAPLWLSLSIFGKGVGPWRYAWFFLAGATAIGVLASGNLAGCLALGAGLVAFGVLAGLVARRQLDPVIARRGLVAVAAVALLGAISLLLAARPLSGLVARDVLTKSHGVSLPAAWEAGVKQAGESPWLGTGSRTSHYYGRLFRPDRIGGEAGEPAFVHNEFLQLAADYGLVGVMLLLGVLGWHFRGGLRFVEAYAESPPPPGRLAPRSDRLALALGALASLASMAFLCLFDFAMHLPVFAVTASVLLAILAAPDPMATALKTGSRPILPGGFFLFAGRAVSFGCGLALLLLGAIFVQSEFHYERARLAFEKRGGGFGSLAHLERARSLDPRNHRVHTLSGRARVAGLGPDAAEADRRGALEKAQGHFEKARRLYPQDIFAAVDHAAVLDTLGRESEARERLRDARVWAPDHGNLMLAEAEHHLRRGDVAEAESSFREALGARALRDAEAAREGLRVVSEWRTIARRAGAPADGEPPANGEPSLERPGQQERRLPEARVEERAVAGRVNSESESKSGPPTAAAEETAAN